MESEGEAVLTNPFAAADRACHDLDTNSRVMHFPFRAPSNVAMVQMNLWLMLGVSLLQRPPGRCPPPGNIWSGKSVAAAVAPLTMVTVIVDVIQLLEFQKTLIYF